MPLGGETAVFRYFELKDDLTPGGTADAYRLQWDETASDWERFDADPPNDDYDEVEVFDGLGTTRGKGADDDATPDPLTGTIVQARRVGDQWHIVAAQPWPLRVRGLLTAALATTDATFKIDGVVILSPIGAIDIKHLLDASDELTVSNTHDWEGDDNGNCRAEWNEDSEVWEAYQVDCPA